MKKVVVLLALSILTIGASAQKSTVQVLFFKAQLCHCQAAGCNKLEADTKKVTEQNFKGGNVTFKEVLLADSANKPLAEKCDALYQAVTVTLILTDSNNKETSVDVTNIVRTYAVTGDKKTFEKDFTGKINELLK